MLSRLQIQSATDQEDYLKLPAIMTGSSAAVLPEQLACWSYPLPTADADQASFNMVTAMTLPHSPEWAARQDFSGSPGAGLCGHSTL